MGATPGGTHGHFEIVGPLGRGGMGVVYRALDTRLGRTVALKFLPPFLSADDDARERFFAEARAASALDHPNICTVHEISETADGQAFIAMALYEGETLEAKIAGGPLPVEEAIGYARQMAAGLAKAHAAGIVHRDMKPANVIITTDGIAKILDFGLAKLADVHLTKTGDVVGSVKYMSPEHTEGKKVDRRTDLWSIGVMLYEMLAGRHPFGESHTGNIMYGILHEQPEPLAGLNPRVPEPVQRIVEGCLVKDRARRYQSADELLDDLDRLAGAVDPVTGPRGLPPAAAGRSKGRTRTRGLALAGTVLVLLVAVAVAIPQARRAVFGGSAERVDRTYLAVLPLTAVTGDPEDEVLAEGLTHSLTAMLVSLESGRDPLLVVPASEIAGQGIRSVGDARRIFGITAALSGSLGRDDMGAANLRLDLVQPDPVAVVDNATVPGPGTPDFQEGVRQALSRLLGVDRARVDEALVANEPADPDAYEFYLQGLGYLGRRDLENAIEHATEMFTKATDIDPEYAVAWAGLCEAQLERFRATADTLYANSAIDNCDRAANLAGDQPDVLVSLGALLLQTGEPDRAIRRLREAATLDPDDADVHRWIGRYFEAEGIADSVTPAYERAIALQPDSWVYRQELATWFAYRGRLDEAREQYERIRTLTPDNYLAYNGLGFLLMIQGDGDGAARYFRQSLERRPNPIAYRNLGYLHNRAGRWSEAIEALESALAINEADWYSWRWLGHARHWNGEFELARAAWQQAVDVVSAFVDVNRDDVDLRLGLAEVLVLLGDLDEGRRHLGLALLREMPWNYHPYFAGRLFEILGQRELALDYLRQAYERGFDPLMFETDPWLADLRSDERWPSVVGRTSTS